MRKISSGLMMSMDGCENNMEVSGTGGGERPFPGDLKQRTHSELVMNILSGVSTSSYQFVVDFD